MHFRIAGKNPRPQECRAYIDSLAESEQPEDDLRPVAFAAARHESKDYNNLGWHRFYNQFWMHNCRDHGRRVNNGVNYDFKPGEPLWVRTSGERGVGGLGIMQATGLNGNPGTSLPETVLWNWQLSIYAAMKEMKEVKLPLAKTLINRLETAYPSWPDLESQQTGSIGALHAAVLTHYNGFAGGQLRRPRLFKKGLSCWWPDSSKRNGTTTRTWRFLQNQYNYLKEINAMKVIEGP